jgi:hypothetical protein
MSVQINPDDGADFFLDEGEERIGGTMKPYDIDKLIMSISKLPLSETIELSIEPLCNCMPENIGDDVARILRAFVIQAQELEDTNAYMMEILEKVASVVHEGEKEETLQ